MAFFRKFGIIGAPAFLLATAAVSTNGCSSVSALGEDVCGPCGEVAKGDIGISGNAKLDGFFAAVSQLNNATVSASADFEGGLKNLEAAFGVTATGDLSARVDAIVTKIQGEITANASAGLQVNIQPAKCSANVDVAVEAQASCEAKADCKVEADPGSVQVECKGECTGSCTGGCSADVECKASAGGIACEGKCEGSCELEAAAACEGSCHGDCSGECSVRDGSGKCAGKCDGMCQGTCELSGSASCSGKCTGSCTATLPEADCKGEAKCSAECTGKCEGGCTGEATPPSASAECDASAECKGQAKAQASASLTCTPPSIEIGFEFTGDATAQAKFLAEIAALKANLGVMVGSFTKYSALIDGKVNGEVKFNPTPVAAVTAGLEGVIEAGVEGELFADIPAGKITCVLPAMEAAVTMLGDISSGAAANLKAQGSFVAAVSGGFKS
jgi:hypothetical protein